jgi:hypothetical protein
MGSIGYCIAENGRMDRDMLRQHKLMDFAPFFTLLCMPLYHLLSLRKRTHVNEWCLSKVLWRYVRPMINDFTH